MTHDDTSANKISPTKGFCLRDRLRLFPGHYLLHIIKSLSNETSNSRWNLRGAACSMNDSLRWNLPGATGLVNDSLS